MVTFDAPMNEGGTATLAQLVASAEPGPVREAATTEFAAIVTACMARLPGSQQEVLRLRNVQHLSYAFISRRLGIGLGTVKSRIARARSNLRVLLIAAYPELAPDASPLACFEPLRASAALQAICA
jgi:RNA polymerase sigma-70 factor (ECF subfamily)